MPGARLGGWAAAEALSRPAVRPAEWNIVRNERQALSLPSLPRRHRLALRGFHSAPVLRKELLEHGKEL